MLLWTAAPAAAQQLTNPDGQTLVIQNDGAVHAAEFNYSLHYDLAIGPVVSFEDGPDVGFGGVQLTYLVKRINGDFSQFNIVANAGIGVEDGPGQSRVAGFAQGSATYMTRRAFVSYALRASFAENSDVGLRQVGRVGIAPYVAKQGHIQPFLAMQIDRFDGPRAEWRATPYVRLIKDAALVEVGVNSNGGVLANFVYLF